jgi:hypothetical protein
MQTVLLALASSCVDDVCRYSRTVNKYEGRESDMQDSNQHHSSTFMVYNMRSQQQIWGAVGGQKK